MLLQKRLLEIRRNKQNQFSNSFSNKSHGQNSASSFARSQQAAKQRIKEDNRLLLTRLKRVVKEEPKYPYKIKPSPQEAILNAAKRREDKKSNHGLSRWKYSSVAEDMEPLRGHYEQTFMTQARENIRKKYHKEGKRDKAHRLSMRKEPMPRREKLGQSEQSHLNCLGRQNRTFDNRRSQEKRILRYKDPSNARRYRSVTYDQYIPLATRYNYA